MSTIIQNYTDAAIGVLKHFSCPEDYLLKSMTNVNWRVWDADGIYFLSYWNEQMPEKSLVMARKNGQLQLFRTPTHTMAVAIDCVKIGFLLDNELEHAPQQKAIESV